MTNNGQVHVLEEVYFIPSMCNNIISLGQLCESGNRVVIKGEFLWVYAVNENLLLKVKRSTNRLYKVIIKEFKGLCLLSKAEEISWLWHSRLGHVNFQSMLLMSENRMARGLPDLTHSKGVCEGCLMSKQA